MQIANQIDQLLDRAAQPVELPDDQGIDFVQYLERLDKPGRSAREPLTLSSKTFLHPALVKASLSRF